MKNLDLLKQQKADILQKMTQAIKADDQQAYADAFSELLDTVEQAVLAEAKGLINAADANILASRGVRQLTSEESNYWQQAIDAMKSNNPKQSLAGLDNVLPKTTIDTVFEDLKETHPLLDLINFQDTGALIEIITSTTSGAAAWGELTAEIIAELSATFGMSKHTLSKLSAFIPIAKSMLDLGPVWMDRYAREILVEALAVQLEAGIADEDGDDAPIGMTRALTGAVDGVYPRKTPVVITDLDPDTYGSILNTLSQGPNGKRRAISEIIMVVNPQDYFTKVMPATTVRDTQGNYVNNVFPFPTKVVQSPSIPSGRAVFGLAKRYFFGLGTAKGGKLEYDDSYKFLEDVRVYLIKLYGYGCPLDANAFVYADISGLKPYVKQVYVTNEELPVINGEVPFSVYGVNDARLAALTIGSLTLSPVFNKSVFVYTASTTNATNTITATPKDGEATVEILNGVNPVANGAAATWAEGENVVTINVTSGDETETYTVTVTKTS